MSALRDSASWAGLGKLARALRAHVAADKAEQLARQGVG